MVKNKTFFNFSRIQIIQFLFIFIATFIFLSVMVSFVPFDSILNIFLSGGLLVIVIYFIYFSQKKAELDNRCHLIKDMLDGLVEGVLILDASKNTILSVNPAFTIITGYTEQEAIGQTLQFLCSNKHEKIFYEKMRKTILKTGRWNGKVWNQRKDGDDYPLWLSIFVINNARGNPEKYVGIFYDLNEIKEVRAQLVDKAHYDSLTGLPNMKLVKILLRQTMEKAAQDHESIAVFLLNVDRFKNINESLGYQAGDLLLALIAKRLRRCIKVDDVVARWEGNSFVFILKKLKKKENVFGTASRIERHLNASFRINNQDIHVTASIGITIFPEDGNDVDSLLKNAEMAMYRAKEKGTNNWQLYHAQMNVLAFERLELENKLRKAIEKENLLVHYQPKVDLQTGAIIGMEALVRWKDKDRGIIPPGDFIPLAEESGLISAIGEWVLRKSCEQNRKWQDAGYVPITIAVNVSARQFQEKTFLKTVKRILSDTGLSPEYLDLEITESMVMDNAQLANSILNKLNKMGIQISMDDFGTGYSSLSVLKKFPFSTLKIDRSFIKDIPANSEDAAIVRVIISLARNLNLKVVAEGVETAENLKFLREQHCDQIQGYFFSRPLPSEEITKMFQEGKHL